MIRIKSSVKDGPIVRKNQIRTLMTVTYEVTLGLCGIFGILRWLQYANVLNWTDAQFFSVLLGLLLFIGGISGVFVILVKTRSFTLHPSAKIGQADGEIAAEEDGEKAAQEEGVQETSASPRARSPLTWRVFEICLLVSATIAFMGCFMRNFPGQVPATSVIWSSSWDRFLEVYLVLLIFYAAVKTPLVIGTIMDEQTRGYMGHWRVHESVFGIAWVVVATLWLLFGDFYERFFGIIFLLQGAILIGKDQRDVQKFAFIEKVPKHQAGGN